jgi:hypothetical protein
MDEHAARVALQRMQLLELPQRHVFGHPEAQLELLRDALVEQ